MTKDVPNMSSPTNNITSVLKETRLFQLPRTSS